MAADAFTAGVKPGGLTSVTEIRILLCYLVKMAGPVSREIIQEALLQEQLVNYFELSSSWLDLETQHLVTLKDGQYHITEKGILVAQNLSYDLPKSVRESAVRAVLRMQTWARKAAEHQAEILSDQSGYTVCCHIEDQGETVFSMNVAMPDQLTAEKVKNCFIEDGANIYSLFIQELLKQD